MIGSTHNFFTISLTVVHTVFALAVTVHVLLHKREVGSAIGWMGLAWLSPVIGSVLYVVFGINRIHRKAYRIRRRRPAWQGRQKQGGAARDDQLAPLAQAVATITQRPLQPGNAIHLLRNGDEAYPAMLAAIEAATVSIGMASYIFRHDEIGEKFVGALIAAKARGVDVRVLIDSIGSGYFYSGVLHRLRKQGVKAARFMHSFLPWQMSFLNLRNHRKILVVDGTTAFIGGINIADENVQAGQPSHPVRDVHFEVEGPVVDQIAEAFAVDWWLTTGEELKDISWFPPLSGGGSAQARVITSGPDLDIEKMDLIFLQAIASARQSIKVATPYFLPDERLITALRLAVMRGVAVDIVVPEESDHLVVDWAMLANAEPLLATGVSLWLAPKPFEHSKLLTIDGTWSLIGSANWDVRSMRLNFEITLEVYDADFARLIAAQIDRRKGRQLTFAEIATQPLAIRLRDRAARLLLPYL
jgi:cardiolipin synthase